MTKRLQNLALGLGILAASFLTGCGGAGQWEWNYALGALAGELAYLNRAVPIEQGLEDPDLPQDHKDKLEIVIKARDYAEQVMGLNVGDSFRRFVNLKGEPLAWNLSASRKDALEAYHWDIPVIGSIPYLGFFVREQAIAERDRLVAGGYDTFMYELDAFSTLGLLPDPLASSLLNRSTVGLADTVIHELLHNTIFSTGQMTFNESLATFVGRTGALEFLEFEFGSDAPIVAEAIDDYADKDIIDEFLRQLIADAAELYARDISPDEKIALREEVFEAARQRFKDEVQPTMRRPERNAVYGELNYNNAFLLVNVRYNNDLDVFAAVHESTGRNWSESLAIFSQAADSPDAYAFLRKYVDATEQAAE